MDWSATRLGPPEQWPPELRTAAAVVAATQAPAWLWWGPAQITITNGACARLCGPTPANGIPALELTGEPWATVRGHDHAEDLRIVVDRGHGPEEAFFTLATTRFGEGEQAGALCTLSETTAQVLERRRLEALYQLARVAATTISADDACRSAAIALGAHARDLGFVLVYRIADDRRVARLVGGAGVAGSAPPAPPSIDLTAAATGWPLSRVLASGHGEIVTQLDRIGLDGEPGCAVALPVKVGTAIEAFLCARIARHRRLDSALRGFLDRAVAELAAAFAAGRDREVRIGQLAGLTDLDHKKTDFFIDVTHEFRTPLTLLIAGVEQALIEAKDPMQRDRLRMAHRNAQRLHKLVNHLLDFARIEANQVRASYAPTDLAQLTIDIASSFQSVCDQVGIRLAVDCPPVGEPVFVDPEMWEKIVLNLLANAFKHTLYGRIDVTLRVRGDAVELAVSDTGVGIAPEHLPHVFERFYRIEGARSRSAEGTGIGLAMVRELARWHGGEVAADSTPGAGSQFRVTVRRGSAHLPIAQLDPSHVLISRAARNAFAEEARQWIVDDLEDRVPAGPLGVRPRVLWADDNADMRTYVRRLLATEFEVVAVSDGQAALDAIRSKPFDLVLADVMMPGVDGLSLVETLRADPRDRAVPVLLMSGRSGDDAAIEALEHGADEYLVKPFTPRRLLAAVRSHLELARMRRPPMSS